METITTDELLRDKSVNPDYISNDQNSVTSVSKNGFNLLYSCDICNKYFLYKKNVSRHKLTVHSERSLFTCDICGLKTTYKQSLERHMKCTHKADIKNSLEQKILLQENGTADIGNNDISKSVDNGIVSDYDNVLNHENSKKVGVGETLANDVTCRVCSVGMPPFVNKEMKYIDNEKTYKCECGKEFSGMKKLNRHKATHIDNKIYCCTLCNKNFKYAASLRLHIRAHVACESIRNDGKELLKCLFCDLKLENINLMEDHISDQHISTLQKRKYCTDSKFKCSFCKTSFSSLTLLKIHEMCRHNLETNDEHNALLGVNDNRVPQNELQRHENKTLLRNVAKQNKPSRVKSVSKQYSRTTKPKKSKVTRKQSKTLLQTSSKNLITNLSNNLLEKSPVCSKLLTKASTKKCSSNKIAKSSEPKHSDTNDIKRATRSMSKHNSPQNTKLKSKVYNVKAKSTILVPQTEKPKTFSKKNKVLAQSRIAARINDGYGCDMCDANFSRKSSLDWHKKVHGGILLGREDHFKCDICGESYPEEAIFKKHLKMHKNKKNSSACNKTSKKNLSKKQISSEDDMHMNKKSNSNAVKPKTKKKKTLQQHLNSYDNPTPSDQTCHSFLYAGTPDSETVAMVDVKANKRSNKSRKCVENSNTTGRKMSNDKKCKLLLPSSKMQDQDIGIEKLDISHNSVKLVTSLSPQIVITDNRIENSGPSNLHSSINRKFDADIGKFVGETENNVIKPKAVDQQENTENEMYDCTICNAVFSRKSSLMRHHVVHPELNSEVERKFECTTCGKKFLLHENLVKHKRTHSDQKSHFCNICHRGFKHMKSLRHHQSQEHSEQFSKANNPLHGHSRSQKKKKSKFVIERRFQCDTCNKSYTTKNSLSRHIVIHTELPFKCKICSNRFTRKAHLADHLLIHSGVKPHQCSVCDKFFRHKVGLSSHLKKVHDVYGNRCKLCKEIFLEKSELVVHQKQKHNLIIEKKVYQCSYCDKICKQKGDLHDHEMVHNSTKQFSCDLCGKEFKHYKSMRFHRRNHNVDARNKKEVSNAVHLCDICGVSYKLRSSLMYHRTTHTNLRPFSCEICGKSFKLQSLLKSHLITHTDEKRYICHVCGKKFRNNVHMQEHTRIHTGEKPFKCDICGTTFRHGATLKVHRRIHTEERPYECNLCHRTFVRWLECVEHKRTHSGERPFKCNGCNRKFVRKQHLTRHKKVRATCRKSVIFSEILMNDCLEQNDVNAITVNQSSDEITSTDSKDIPNDSAANSHEITAVTGERDTESKQEIPKLSEVCDIFTVGTDGKPVHWQFYSEEALVVKVLAKNYDENQQNAVQVCSNSDISEEMVMKIEPGVENCVSEHFENISQSIVSSARTDISTVHNSDTSVFPFQSSPKFKECDHNSPSSALHFGQQLDIAPGSDVSPQIIKQHLGGHTNSQIAISMQSDLKSNQTGSHLEGNEANTDEIYLGKTHDDSYIASPQEGEMCMYEMPEKFAQRTEMCKKYGNYSLQSKTNQANGQLEMDNSNVWVKCEKSESEFSTLEVENNEDKLVDTPISDINQSYDLTGMTASPGNQKTSVHVDGEKAEVIASKTDENIENFADKEKYGVAGSTVNLHQIVVMRRLEKDEVDICEEDSVDVATTAESVVIIYKTEDISGSIQTDLVDTETECQTEQKAILNITQGCQPEASVLPESITEYSQIKNDEIVAEMNESWTCRMQNAQCEMNPDNGQEDESAHRSEINIGNSERYESSIGKTQECELNTDNTQEHEINMDNLQNCEIILDNPQEYEKNNGSTSECKIDISNTNESDVSHDNKLGNTITIEECELKARTWQECDESTENTEQCVIGNTEKCEILSGNRQAMDRHIANSKGWESNSGNTQNTDKEQKCALFSSSIHAFKINIEHPHECEIKISNTRETEVNTDKTQENDRNTEGKQEYEKNISSKQKNGIKTGNTQEKEINISNTNECKENGKTQDHDISNTQKYEESVSNTQDRDVTVSNTHECDVTVSNTQDRDVTVSNTQECEESITNTHECDVTVSITQDRDVTVSNTQECEESVHNTQECEESVHNTQECDVTVSITQDRDVTVSNTQECEESVHNTQECDVTVGNIQECDVTVGNTQECDVAVSNTLECDVTVGNTQECDVTGSNTQECDVAVSNTLECDVTVGNTQECDVTVSNTLECDVTVSNTQECEESVSKTQECDVAVSSTQECEVTVINTLECDVTVSSTHKCEADVCNMQDCEQDVSNTQDCEEDFSNIQDCEEDFSNTQDCDVIAATTKEFETKSGKEQKLEVNSDWTCRKSQKIVSVIDQNSMNHDQNTVSDIVSTISGVGTGYGYTAGGRTIDEPTDTIDSSENSENENRVPIVFSIKKEFDMGMGCDSSNGTNKYRRDRSTTDDNKKEIKGKHPKLKCDTCGKVFRREINFLNHRNSHLNTKKPFKCLGCGLGFDVESQLLSHKKKHIHSLKCNTCKEVFSEENEFICHKTNSACIKSLLCDICNKRFSCNSSLQRHIRVHNNDKPFMCNFCGKNFVCKTGLKTHMQGVHTTERPYHCGICDKGFMTTSNLKEHERTHTGDKNLQCDICGRMFIHRFNLKRHKLVHTGEKPYECEQCGAKYRYYKDLAVHKRKHSGERPFSCDICAKSFVRGNHLTRHKKIHEKKSSTRAKLPEKFQNTISETLLPVPELSSLPVTFLGSDQQSSLQVVENYVNFQDDVIFQCYKCLEIFSSFPEVEAHSCFAESMA